MMDRVMTELSFLFYKEDGHQAEIELERINCHHNFTQRENHFNENVWVTRKGAIQMKEGQKGVIPGSMRTRYSRIDGNALLRCLRTRKQDGLSLGTSRGGP
jgi:tRNA-splicing ligase RtcB